MPRSKSKSKEAKDQQTQMVDARPTRKKRPPTELVERPPTKRKRVAEAPISTTEQIESTAENNAKDIAHLKEQIGKQSVQQQQLINQKLIELIQMNTNQKQKKGKIKNSSTATSSDSDSDSESLLSDSDSVQSESDT